MHGYDEAYFRRRASWLDFRLEIEALLELARLGPGNRVLELGCGGGELLARLERQARLLAGVDLSQEGLRLARGVTGAGLLGARAENLPFQSRSFDAVLSQHLIEHLPHPVESLREWHRVLRPGGVLAMVTPNAACPDTGLFRDPGHVSLFTPATLQAALEDAGFRVTRLFTLFPYLGPGRCARAASIRLAPLARRIPVLRHVGRSIVVAATPVI